MTSDLLDNLFIGAGAMKAGTTWLYSLLETHPEIYFSYEKEIHYFYAAYVRREVLSDHARLRNVEQKYLRFDARQAKPMAIRNKLRWAANYLDGPVDDAWYRNLFMLRGQQTYAADFSNLYALLPADAWARINGRIGRLRVLYTMRDPVQRLWSHTKFHLKVSGQSDALDTWKAKDVAQFIRQPFIWENAEYGQAIRHMRNGLPHEALKFAWHEEIHQDECSFLAEIESFLEIGPHSYPEDRLHRKVNATAPRPVPEFFVDIVAKDVERIIQELTDLGLSPPASWQNSLDQTASA